MKVKFKYLGSKRSIMPEELYCDERYKSILLRTLGDHPKLRIIDFFLENPLFDFTKKEVIEALGMGKRTFYKHFKEIEEQGIVIVSRRIGRTKLYKINLKHPLVKALRQYETEISLRIAEEELKKQKAIVRE